MIDKLNVRELAWYGMLRKYIEDTAKYKLFENEFKKILDLLVGSLLDRVKDD